MKRRVKQYLATALALVMVFGTIITAIPASNSLAAPKKPTLSTKKVTVEVKAKKKITVKGKVKIKSTKWSVANKKVVSLSNKSKKSVTIKGKKAGKTKVTAKVKVGKKTTSLKCNVTVKLAKTPSNTKKPATQAPATQAPATQAPAKPETMAIQGTGNHNIYTLDEATAGINFAGYLLDAKGNSIGKTTNQDIKLKEANDTGASITSAGKLTAKEVGEVTLELGASDSFSGAVLKFEIVDGHRVNLKDSAFNASQNQNEVTFKYDEVTDKVSIAGSGGSNYGIGFNLTGSNLTLPAGRGVNRIAGVRFDYTLDADKELTAYASKSDDWKGKVTLSGDDTAMSRTEPFLASNNKGEIEFDYEMDGVPEPINRNFNFAIGVKASSVAFSLSEVILLYQPKTPLLYVDLTDANNIKKASSGYDQTVITPESEGSSCHIVTSGYGTAFVLKFTIPSGGNLQDYKGIQFDIQCNSEENDYKKMHAVLGNVLGNPFSDDDGVCIDPNLLGISDDNLPTGTTTWSESQLISFDKALADTNKTGDVYIAMTLNAGSTDAWTDFNIKNVALVPEY